MSRILNTMLLAVICFILVTTSTYSQNEPTWEICDVSPDGEQLLALKVFFLSGNLFILNPDGSVVERLTNDEGSNCGAWSPDGAQIAYSANVGGKEILHIMNLGNHQVENQPLIEVGVPRLDWSPDSTSIVFNLRRQGLAIFDVFTEQVMVIDVDGYSPNWSPNGDKITFISSAIDSDRDIYVVNKDGSNIQRLTSDEARESSPTWSPNGDEIAFFSDREVSDNTYGRSDLFSIDPTSLEVTQLTDGELPVGAPYFSTDSSVIYFQSATEGIRALYSISREDMQQTLIFDAVVEGLSNDQQLADLEGYQSLITFGKDVILYFARNGDSPNHIYAVDPSTGNQWQLTQGDMSEFNPTWTPDGSQIVFSKGPALRGGGPSDFDIFVMSPYGTDELRLTFIEPEQGQSTAFDVATSPSVSPDGTRIVFSASDAFFDNTDIFIMDFDGSNIEPLTNAPYLNDSPVWSPDGNEIAFVSNQTGSNEIYIMNPDGSNIRQLTSLGQNNSSPVWSPDGNEIAFVSGPYGKQEIYVMNSDGSNVRQLTNNDHPDFDPDWSPDGTRIAYISVVDGDRELFIMNSNGSNVQRLTNNFEDEFGPVWRPINIVAIGEPVLDEGQRTSSPTGIFSIELPSSWTLSEMTSGEVTLNVPNTTNLFAGVLAPFSLYRSNLDPSVNPEELFRQLLANNGGSPVGDMQSLDLSIGNAIRQDYTVSNQQGILITIETETDGLLLFYAQGNPTTLQNQELALLGILETLEYDSEAAKIASEQVLCSIRSSSGVNLRGGPGTEFDVVGTLSPNTNTDVDGKTTGTDGFTWWHLTDESGWVREDVVSEIGECTRLPFREPQG